ncbi:unnamed protein product [Trichogramma brassicae]|uniref:Mutator-like transposase domain-containing protein n=1 Tax=Trichogramma brassicae TaxID=86971 RepID=A0A6H5IK56_9HYME|nr:unnamed protein product [Trichogramma brassicae]
MENAAKTIMVRLEIWKSMHKIDVPIDRFRSIDNNVKYRNYIGDGDSKTYTGLINSKTYGNKFLINKKECVGHVQKRMGTRLRELVKNSVVDTVSKAGKKMKNAIWSTYYHYSSTDVNQQHQKCPLGENSCTQRLCIQTLSRGKIRGIVTRFELHILLYYTTRFTLNCDGVVCAKHNTVDAGNRLKTVRDRSARCHWPCHTDRVEVREYQVGIVAHVQSVHVTTRQCERRRIESILSS